MSQTAAVGPPAASPPRRRLGPYLLERPLGQGAQGVVWFARHEGLGRPAAVKILTSENAADADFARRFHQEARLAARLDHRHAVRVYDSGTDRGIYWLAMELIDGPSVGEVVRRDGPMVIADALEITRGIASALVAASEAGILHRDVKPQNILLERDGVAKLADLGLAREDGHKAPHLTASGIVVGTPFYMAPEQAMGRRDLDVRVDIYALGISLFEMLTGTIPLTGESTVATVLRHNEEDVPPPSSVRADIPPSVDALVCRMAARDRERRFRDARALEAEIGALLAGPTLAPPTRTTERRESPARDAESDVGWGAERAPAPAPRSRAPMVAAVAIAFVVATAAGILIGNLGDGVSDAAPIAARPLPAATSAAERLRAREDLERRSSPPAEGDPERPAATIPSPVIPAEDRRDPFERSALAVIDAYETGGAVAALARYRELEIGADLDRLARSSEGLRVGALLTLWAWCRIDRALAGDLDNANAAVSVLVQYRRDAPPELGVMMAATDAIAFDAVDATRVIMGARDPRFSLHYPPLQPAKIERAAPLLGPAASDALVALGRARLFLPGLVAIEAEPSPLFDPDELAERFDDVVAPVRAGLPALERELRASVAAVLARVEREVNDVRVSRVVRMRLTDAANELGLHTEPTDYYFPGHVRGLVYIGPEEALRSIGDEIRLELRGLARYRRIEIDLYGLRPPLGFSFRRAHRPVAAALVDPTGGGVVTLDPESSVTHRLLERIAAGGIDEGTTRVSIELRADGARPVVTVNGASSTLELGAATADAGRSLRLHLAPGAVIEEVRLHLAER